MAPSGLNIPKEKLIELYIRQKLSTDAIAKRFGCTHVTVLNYLKKYNLPRRTRLGTRKAVIVDKEILFDLYNKKKLTQGLIAKQLSCSRFGIYRLMKIYKLKARNYSESHTKYPKKDFAGDPIEKAYIIGFRLGDLNVYKVHELIQVRCSTTKVSQIKLIKNLFRNYGNVHIWKAKRGTFEVIVLLNKSFNFLLPKYDKIEDWILEDKNCFISFLAGYSDAEGSYYLRKPYYKNARCGWGTFEISTFDRNIIHSLWSRIAVMGISAKFTKSRTAGTIDERGLKTNKDVWRLTISKKQSLWDFIKIIETFHKHDDRLKSLKKVKKNLQLRNCLPYYRKINF